MKPEWWQEVAEINADGSGVLEVIGRAYEHLGFAKYADGRGLVDRHELEVPSDNWRRITYREGVDTNRRKSEVKGGEVHAFQYLSPLSCLDVIKASTAEEFLTYLSIEKPAWGSGSEVPWIFRGHADSNWFLQPSAWRKRGKMDLRPLIEQFESHEVWGDRNVQRELAVDEPTGRRIGGSIQRAAEYEAVYRFGELADRLGLPVHRKEVSLPNGDQFLRRIDLNIVDGHYGLEETVACLAQHHGIPTALLDWTSDPWTAAFFAAAEADRQCEEWNEGIADLGPDSGGGGSLSGEMAVWALDLSRVPEISLPLIGDREGILRSVRCPRSQHNFLHAQDGLFLMYSQSGDYFMKHGVWPVFEDVLESVYADGSKALRKIMLPKAEARNVLRKLWRRKYYRARLMPTYDNVANSALHRLKFDD